MTIRDYLQVLRLQRRLVAGVALAALLAAGTLWVLRAREYTAHLVMYVSAPATDAPEAAYQAGLLSQQRVSSYMELVGSSRVSSEVVRDLGLPDDPERLAGDITASSPPGSVLIAVDVVDRDPQRAAAVAGSVGRVFPALVTDLERASPPGSAPPVAVRVVQPATVPTAPSSTSLPVTLGLGLLVGIVGGAVAGLTRNALDTSIRSGEVLRTVTGTRTLATVPEDPEPDRGPLQVRDGPQVEAYRQLRAALRLADVQCPHKLVIVTGPLPGTGTSTAVARLAHAAAAPGGRVLVLDANLRRPRAAELLGVERSGGLTDVLADRATVPEVLQRCPDAPVDVLATGPVPPDPGELMGSRRIAALLADLRDRYDLVLIDAPPLLPVADALATAPSADGVLLVCRFGRSTREQVGLAVEAVTAAAPLLGTALLGVPASGEVPGRAPVLLRSE